MSMPRPRHSPQLNQPVHYAGRADALALDSTCRAAVITECRRGETTVSLYVFDPVFGAGFQSNIVKSTEGALNTWHHDHECPQLL